MVNNSSWRGQKADDPYAMTPDELDAFLAEPRYAAVTTHRRDGSMITVFLGFEWDGEAFYLSMRNSRFINQRLARDGRAAIAITNESYPAKYVIADGTVEVIDDPDFVLTRRKFLRTMSTDNDFQTNKDIDLEAFWANYLTVGRTMYRLTPTRLKSEDASKWPDELGGAGTSDVLAKEAGTV